MAYTFQEYPKWLHFEGKPSVRVLSRVEEDAVLGGSADHKSPKPPKASTEHTGVDRRALIAKAKAAGVKKANFLTTEELLKQVG